MFCYKNISFKGEVYFGYDMYGWVKKGLCVLYHFRQKLNPSNAESTFVQSTRTQRSKPCHVGIYWKALAEISQMSTHVPGFQLFFSSFASFCIGQISH